ncbi:hypothetical protein ZEAMMB73_Zm00001d025557 [Zea mays]|uniref:Polyadenylate-binding protein RBP47C n=1 Tax=Zea mays TaxID=4577 RepID=A0A1D6J7R9_MAIZE|nr:hypothetical protein ZEAMMB73_Zm00001d025557 [Zea mays]
MLCVMYHDVAHVLCNLSSFYDLFTELDDYCTQVILAPRLLVIQMVILLTERFVSCDCSCRTDAEEALQGLNGSLIGKQAVRLSWVRSPSHKQSRGDSVNRRNNMYYGTPFYGGYGYASPVPHPNMYAAAYGTYPLYGNQQLVS